MSLSKILSIWLILSFTCCSVSGEEPGKPAEKQWFKGNLHTHTLWSDGNDFPEMVAKWYGDNGYNFLALTDHNVLSKGEKWMSLASIEKRSGGMALEKYLETYGSNWVETRGDREAGTMEVRLKTLEEFRGKVERDNKFIMIQGEEISDSVAGKPVHMNATNLTEVISPVGGSTVREAMRNNLRAANLQVKKTGKPMLVHLNHPNFGYAVTAEDLAAVTEEKFFEVYNGHPAVGHLGKKGYSSVERIWDIANTIRIGKLNSAPLYGMGTDDSHEYFRPEGSRVGRSWVMVNCESLDPKSIISAMENGAFYSSSGVTLDDIHYDAIGRRLRLMIKPEDGVTYQTKFIGTMKDYDEASTPAVDAKGEPIKATRNYSEEVGKILATVEGTSAEYKLTGNELYVRAVVTGSKAHNDPSFTNQKIQAWTQPVGWRK